MAPHSSTLAWKIPWMEEPGRLQSMGSRRVEYDWATSLSLFTFMRWRRKWQPTPVFLPGESQEREPGGLPSMGSHRVGHDWSDLAAVAAATVLLEKTLESSLDSKEIKPVNPKGNQPWIFVGRTNAEAEAPILWPPGAKNWLIGKDSDAGKGGGQEKKGTTEDEMVGWHHQLNRCESEQTPRDGEGQGSLVCCSPWSCKELDMSEQLNNSNKSYCIESRL